MFFGFNQHSDRPFFLARGRPPLGAMFRNTFHQTGYLSILNAVGSKPLQLGSADGARRGKRAGGGNNMMTRASFFLRPPLPPPIAPRVCASRDRARQRERYEGSG